MPACGNRESCSWGPARARRSGPASPTTRGRQLAASAGGPRRWSWRGSRARVPLLTRKLRALENERAIADEQQAALRRVATLVGRGSPPSTVFSAVAEEAGRLLAADVTILRRHEPG